MNLAALYIEKHRIFGLWRRRCRAFLDLKSKVSLARKVSDWKDTLERQWIRWTIAALPIHSQKHAIFGLPKRMECKRTPELLISAAL